MFGNSILLGQEALRFGIFIRQTVIKVNPENVLQWEDAVREIAAAARQAKSPHHDWLLYRTASNNYWLIQFGDSIQNLPTERSFHEGFNGLESNARYLEALANLLATDFVLIRDCVYQQDIVWSTVKEMSTKTHPKAQVVDFIVKPGKEAAFDENQQKMVTLLQQIDYPFPVESFRPRFGAPRSNQVVVFPDTWENFYGINDLTLLASKAGKKTELEAIFSERNSLLLEKTVANLDFEKAMSYSP